MHRPKQFLDPWTSKWLDAQRDGASVARQHDQRAIWKQRRQPARCPVIETMRSFGAMSSRSDVGPSRIVEMCVSATAQVRPPSRRISRTAMSLAKYPFGRTPQVKASIFASDRKLCSSGSVYPFGCARPSKTRARAAMKARLLLGSGAMGR